MIWEKFILNLFEKKISKSGSVGPVKQGGVCFVNNEFLTLFKGRKGVGSLAKGVKGALTTLGYE